MPGLTVTEKNHWRDRIAARIARAVERIKARHPALFDRIARQAHAQALASLGLADAHAELEAIKAEEATLARRKKHAQKAMIATLRSMPIDEVDRHLQRPLRQRAGPAQRGRRGDHPPPVRPPGAAAGRRPDRPRDRQARGREGPPARHDLAGVLAGPDQATLDPGRRAARRRADGPGTRGAGDRAGEGGLMPRRPPHRRRRPGRRPPHRYSGGPGPPGPAGFTGPGFRQAWSWLLPGLGGPRRSAYFNEVSGGIVLAGGLCGLVLGLAWLGPIGAILGLGAGVAAGGSFAGSGRFYRD